MEIESHFGGNLSDAERLELIAVQYTSPFVSRELFPVAGKTKLRWNDRDDERADIARARKIKLLVKNLEQILEPKPSLSRVIAFPEYSVPKIAHDEIDFQSVADRLNSVLIPGSYWEDDEQSAHYGMHVCRVYLANKPPFLIGKKHPIPLEARWMTPASDIPSIGRIWWERENGSNVDISIFLCRDYLSTTRGVSPSRKSKNKASKSKALPEFSSEGINIVLMHNEEHALFDGVAGIDLRNFRGERRMALFVNNAKVDQSRGTAIVGTTGERESRDVVRSLPPNLNGFLKIRARLWDLEYKVSRPDTRVDSPINSVEAFTIEPEMHFIETVSRGSDPSYRAIWRPAFLEAIQMGIVIEFYAVEKEIGKVEKYFIDGEVVQQDTVQNVYAGTIKGTHDIAIRRYVPVGSLHDERRRSFLYEQKASTQDFLKQRLRKRDQLVFAIRPQHILKYRGRNAEFETYEEQKSAVRRAFPKRRNRSEEKARSDLIENVLFLADSTTCDSIPDDLLPFVFPEPEEIIPVVDNDPIIETYILIARAAQTEGSPLESLFDEECMHGRMMDNIHVREIFKLDMTNDSWNFLIKLKCTRIQTNAIGRELRDFGDDHGLRVNTRTIDFVSYLKQSSLTSVAKSMQTYAAKEFFAEFEERCSPEEIFKINQIQRGDQKIELLTEISEARAGSNPNFYPSDEEIDLVFNFYSNLLLFMIEENTTIKLRYRKELLVAWVALYQRVEGLSKEILDMIFDRGGIGDPKEYETVVDALRAGPLAKMPDKTWNMKRSDELGLLLEYLSKVDILKVLNIGDASVPAMASRQVVKSEISRLTRLRTEYRNPMIHASKLYIVEQKLDWSNGDWKTKLDGWKDSVVSMLNLLGHMREIRSLARDERV